MWDHTCWTMKNVRRHVLNNEKCETTRVKQWKIWDRTCWTMKNVRPHVLSNEKCETTRVEQRRWQLISRRLILTRFSTSWTSAGFGWSNSANFTLVLLSPCSHQKFLQKNKLLQSLKRKPKILFGEMMSLRVFYQNEFLYLLMYCFLFFDIYFCYI